MSAISFCLCLSSRSVAERSVFLRILHKFVISTEGVAVVEKPAGKSEFDHGSHSKSRWNPYCLRDLGRIQAGSSTTLRFAQNDSFYMFMRPKYYSFDDTSQCTLGHFHYRFRENSQEFTFCCGTIFPSVTSNPTCCAHLSSLLLLPPRSSALLHPRKPLSTLVKTHSATGTSRSPATAFTSR